MDSRGRLRGIVDDFSVFSLDADWLGTVVSNVILMIGERFWYGTYNNWPVLIVQKNVY